MEISIVTFLFTNPLLFVVGFVFGTNCFFSIDHRCVAFRWSSNQCGSLTIVTFFSSFHFPLSMELIRNGVLLEKLTDMAEIATNTINARHRGFARSKKLSTRVDLTPMVDLGFLLITFFIFTTTVAKPTAMKLVMPDEAPTARPNLTSEDKTLTLLLGKSDRLFYYPGAFKGEIKEIDFKQLRNIIIAKKRQIFRKFRSSDLVILIKPMNEANFKNIVDSLDEMLINSVSTYMLLEPDRKELEVIK